MYRTTGAFSNGPSCALSRTYSATKSRYVIGAVCASRQRFSRYRAPLLRLYAGSIRNASRSRKSFVDGWFE